MATIEKLLAEACRLRLLSGLEESLVALGHATVAGVDEAGRGCLAGPVVAAAVVPDPRLRIPGVDDSKRLAPELRSRLAERIRATSLATSVRAVSPRTIDRVNILEATRRAMVGALEALDERPGCALVDAVALPEAPVPIVAIVKGDALSYAIACASVVAKVERDRLMGDLDRRYPHYGFSRHKGYAAPEHLAALASYGPCPEHRLTFRSVVPRTEVA